MSLKEKMSALADAIRSKTYSVAPMTIDQMTTAVRSISVGSGGDGDVEVRSLTVTPSKVTQTFTSSDLGENAYYGTVTVNAIPSDYITTSDATATSGDILSGKTAYVNGRKVTGTIPTVTASLSGNVVNVPAGYIAETKTITVGTAKEAQTITPGTADITIPADTYLSGEQIIKGDADLIADNIKKGVSIFGVSGRVDAGTFTADATAVSGDILEGKTAYVNGRKVTGSMTNHGDVVAKVSNAIGAWRSTAGYYNSIEVSLTTKSLTITPSDTTQTFSAVSNEEDDVFYTHVTVEGIDNLFSSNIKTGVSIAGVEGSFTADATATVADILKGKTAYVDGKKISGLCNLPTPDVVAYGVKFGYRDLNTGKYELEGTYTGDATASTGDILEGKVAYSHGNRFVGTIRKVEGETVTPGTEDVSTSFNYYLTSPWIVKGDANLIAENIKSGVTIFNVTGGFTSDADATASDIAQGKTAYVKGEKVTGTAGGADFYKCTAVYGPETIVYYTVTGAGADCNGKYSPGETSKNGFPVYEFTNSSNQKWYMYYLFDEMEGGSWIISDSTDVSWPYGGHYCSSSLSSTWYTGELAEGSTAPTVTQGRETINADQAKTWEGERAVKQDDGSYKYSTEITQLSYGSAFRPEVGKAYNADVTVQIAKLKLKSDFITTSTLFAIDAAEGVFDIIQGISPSVYGDGRIVLQDGEFCFDAARALDYPIDASSGMSAMQDFTFEMDYTITSDKTGYCGFFGNKRSWSNMNVQMQWGRSGYRPAMFWADYFGPLSGGDAHKEWVNDGKYHHVAMVRSGDVITLYSDGLAIAEYTGASMPLNFSIENNLSIGVQHVENYIFPGRMKHFRIASEALYTEDFSNKLPGWVGM